MGRKLFSAILAIAASVFAQTTFAKNLAFSVKEGSTINEFIKTEKVAAHVVLRNGSKLRLLVAFPAGNSGTAVWFKPQTPNPNWAIIEKPKPMVQKDEKGRDLYGVEFIVSVNSNILEFEQVLLSSVRVIRDYEYKNPIEEKIKVPPIISGNKLVFARDRLDGAPGYFLSIDALNGLASEKEIRSSDGPILLRIVSLSGEKPLSAFDGEILKPNHRNLPNAKNALEFLSFNDKFMAGSWRFNTYFGRDTLMSLALLGDSLTDEAFESGLQSVLSRLSLNGEVAHEESIGEYAIIENQKLNHIQSDSPVFDYNMIDDDFMLPIVFAQHFSTKKAAMKFLAKINDKGQSNGAALIANFEFIVNSAEKFSLNPNYQNLIELKEGKMAGQWRDSDFGIGGGRFAYDVNAVFVPAALNAIANLSESAILKPYLDTQSLATLSKAKKYAAIWQKRAPDLFKVSIDKTEAQDQLNQYAEEMAISNQTISSPVKFNAIALDSNGKKIKIMNSDDGFALLFSRPVPAELDIIAQNITNQFPKGLLSDAGLIIANPAFEIDAIKRRFGKNEYHGAVIWSWQQALMAKGIETQLLRKDLPMATRTKLLKAQTALWKVIKQNAGLNNGELWSWEFKNGRFKPAHFGQSGSDVDESNAAQLWSSVYLGLKPKNK